MVLVTRSGLRASRSLDRRLRRIAHGTKVARDRSGCAKPHGNANGAGCAPCAKETEAEALILVRTKSLAPKLEERHTRTA